jgi:hypothetical protein
MTGEKFFLVSFLSSTKLRLPQSQSITRLTHFLSLHPQIIFVCQKMSSDRISRPKDGLHDSANQMLRLSRSASMEGTDRQYKQQAFLPPPPKYPGGGGYRGQPQYHHSAQSAYYGNGYENNFPVHVRPTHSRLQTVVTNSFSIDDDRDEHRYSRRHIPAEDRHPSDPARMEPMDQRDMRHESRDQGYGDREAPPKPVHVPLSPPEGAIIPRPQNATTPSSPASKVVADNLKRSFWHHSRPADMEATQPVHPAFLPPKRSRVGHSQKEQETILTPRSQEEIDYHNSEMARRDHSWGGREDDQPHGYHSQSYRKSSQSYQTSQWQQLGPRQSSNSFGYREPPLRQDHSMDELTVQRSWSRDETYRHDPRMTQNGSAFRSLPNNRPAPPHQQYINRQGSFPPPIAQQWQGGSFDSAWSHQMAPSDYGRPQQRDEYDASRDPLRSRTFSRDTGSWDTRDGEMRNASYDPHPEMDPYGYNHPRTPTMSCHQVTPATNDLYRLKSRSMSMDDPMVDVSASSQMGPVTYLSQPEDRISLSETLCTIRENIEVFIANKADVEAPAPGRKHPVAVGQVGLRCIHCRHTTKSSDRVKRAVCYPSSIRRIYRTVIDMKLDHFQHCRFVPQALKDRLEELKAINTRSTGTTMQYFVKAAKKMGMIDAPAGVRMEKSSGDGSIGSPSPIETSNQTPGSPAGVQIQSSPESVSTPVANNSGKMLMRTPSEGSEASVSITSSPSDISMCEEIAGFEGKLILALPEDKMALSPLRCFLRENVYAFSATEEDIAVRTPTTFSVSVGQVGIGCIHCNALPAKERSNRAVCFPFSIGRIYQSVADIQRFHLAECKNVPSEVREKFQTLQSASSKGSKGLATRQYWVTSAKKCGLVDTPKGIRFSRDPAVPTTPAVSLDILAQVASNVTTVNRPLVLPEDKACIADFLYTVMAQLQACRFTEADRNKRRLKDVGCIGVECRHCAGQVESRKFFWSSVNAVESNFVSVHTHMMECKHAPEELKTHLSNMKQMRKEQTSRLKNGSQKAFFHRVWNRLHEAEEKEKQEAANGEEQELPDSPSLDKVPSKHVDSDTQDTEMVSV